LLDDAGFTQIRQKQQIGSIADDRILVMFQALLVVTELVVIKLTGFAAMLFEPPAQVTYTADVVLPDTRTVTTLPKPLGKTTQVWT
jgi:hypothetical protein